MSAEDLVTEVREKDLHQVLLAILTAMLGSALTSRRIVVSGEKMVLERREK
jgi:hypothetical protein